MLRSCCIALALTALVPTAAYAQRKGAFPVRYVDRPLTLPKKTLALNFNVGVTHYEPDGNLGAINSVPIDVGASYGIVDDVTVYVQPLTLHIGRVDAPVIDAHQTDVYYGTFRLGGTFRFFHNDVVEIGARAEFGATGSLDMLHLTGGVPVILHAAHVVRVQTGFFISGFFPVGDSGYLAFPNGRDPDGGIATMGASLPNLLPVPGPGIPIDVSFQLADPFFLGINTGFGLGSFHTQSSDDPAFMPLGFHMGGTVSSRDRPVADIVGKFMWPAFLVGADNDPPQPNLWQVFATADIYLPL